MSGLKHASTALALGKGAVREHCTRS